MSLLMHQAMLMAGVPAANNGPLLHFDGTNGSTTIIDAHGGSTWTASAGAALSTAQVKWGTASLFVNGGYVHTADMGAPLGAEFCIRCWAYNSGGTPRGVFHTNPGGSAAGVALGWGGPSGVWELYHNNAGLACTGSVPVGWFFIAVWRYMGVIYVSIDGHIIGSVADTSDLGNYSTMYVGTYFNTANNWAGYLDDFDIDLTHPVYGSSDFTPPTGPFT